MVSPFLSDTCAIAGRHLRQLLRLPEKLIGFTVMPVAMVAGLDILFGGSMRLPGGGQYGAYVSSGVVTIMAVSVTALSALGVVDDLRDGMFDRLRSLPVDRTAILFGRVAVDSLPLVLTMLGVLVAARAAGWPVGDLGSPAALGGVGLVLLLAVGCSCTGVLLGLTVRNAEAVTSLVPVCLLPLTFLSNAFVQPDGLPGWLRAPAEWNPVSAVITTVRELLGAPGAPVAAGFPGRHAAFIAVGFCLLLIALSVPAAVRAYDHARPPR